MTKLILLSCVVTSLLAMAAYDAAHGATKAAVAAVLIAAANGLLFAGA